MLVVAISHLHSTRRRLKQWLGLQTPPLSLVAFNSDRHGTCRYGLGCGLLLLLFAARAPQQALAEDATATAEPPVAEATTEAEMQPYTEVLAGTEAKFEMLPIPGGTFAMGSPAQEPGRAENEGPVHQVRLDPFWMGKCEVTWDEYEIWMFNLDIQRRPLLGIEPTPRDVLADVIARPTKPYTDMTFGMGKLGFPAICMTHLAAKTYCLWLSAKTGHYYRLPTEAEWEYACRAGTTTAYSFGDDPADLDEFSWYFDNANDGYHKVGKKKPNAWGLHDMHGNVCEWVLDQLIGDFYGRQAEQVSENPYARPTQHYPHVARGGSWDDDPAALRSAVRRGSSKEWKIKDPQIPQSRWYHTDALFVGFRVVRPLVTPSRETQAEYWAPEGEE